MMMMLRVKVLEMLFVIFGILNMGCVLKLFIGVGNILILGSGYDGYSWR